MTKCIASLLIAVAAFGLAYWAIGACKAKRGGLAGLPLEKTIAAIKAELLRLESEGGLGLPLQDVTVTLSVIHAEGASGTVEVPVLETASLKSSEKYTSSSKVTVVLAPPVDTKGFTDGKEMPTLQFAETLKAVKKALAMAMTSEPYLDSKSIELNLSFVLVNDGERGVGVKAKVIDIGVASTLSEETGNTITLRFVNPKYEEEATRTLG